MVGYLIGGAQPLSVLGSLFSAYMSNLDSLVAIGATEDSLSNPYINAAFQGFTLSTVLPPSTNPLISSITFSYISLVPSLTNFADVNLTAVAVVAISSPLGAHCPLTTQSLQLSSAIYGDALRTNLLGQYVRHSILFFSLFIIIFIVTFLLYLPTIIIIIIVLSSLSSFLHVLLLLLLVVMIMIKERHKDCHDSSKTNSL